MVLRMVGVLVGVSMSRGHRAQKAGSASGFQCFPLSAPTQLKSFIRHVPFLIHGDNLIRTNLLGTVQYFDNASLRRQRSRGHCPCFRTRSAKGKSGFRESEDSKSQLRYIYGHHRPGLSIFPSSNWTVYVAQKIHIANPLQPC